MTGSDQPSTVKQVASVQQQHSDRLLDLEDKLHGLNSEIGSLKETMGAQFVVLCKHLGIPPTTDSSESSIAQHQQPIIHLASGNLIRYPKIDFPRFDGTNPRGWIRKCNRFFQLNFVDDLKRVDLASIHFDGKADSWFLDYQEGKTFLDWDKFVHDVYLRFEDVAYDNYVGRFNKLAQTSTVEEYLNVMNLLKLL